MTEPDAQAVGPDAWGIHEHWVDANDRSQRVARETVRLLREVIGTPPETLERTAPVVTRPGRRLGPGLGLGPGPGRVQVICEDGSVRTVEDVLPEDFPLGYHVLRTRDGGERPLIVSPGRCWLPEGRRAWGWTVQLYAVRSESSWGIGDLADLRMVREWTEALGGGFLLVNPLHAVAPTVPQESSPYLPATRRFRNPVYLRVDEVPGLVTGLVPGLENADRDGWERERRAVNDAPRVDRDAVWALKQKVLREVYASNGAAADEAFTRWRREQGAALQEFGTWCVLAQVHGPDWREWPEDLRRPDGPAVPAFAEAHADEVGFHAWLQWLLDEQLRAATGELTVIQDFPVGVAGGGADAWAWQEVLAAGVSVGAPPDMLNTTGQDWGSPPMVPWRLREAGYQPFIDSIRSTIAGAGGLRIDHVMGLFRLWWVPGDGSPTDGAYVRYPSDDLLDIVALESHRARAIVVGEDLGTVEEGVREALAERNILSYRLLWFEDDEPAQWSRAALAAVTTHDLPTVAGLWTGSDTDDQRESTSMSEHDITSGREELLDRLRREGTLADDATVLEAVRAAYHQLGRAPSVLLSATLEDAVLEERRPNVPGTTERDNWSIPLAVPLEDLVRSDVAVEVAGILREAVLRDAVTGDGPERPPGA